MLKNSIPQNCSAKSEPTLSLNASRNPRSVARTGRINVFTVRSANEWLELAKETPMAKMLFGELWHEGELCILFADTNNGKSILAMQIGNSISGGKPIEPLTIRTAPQKVIYFDFEFTPKQLEKRYSEMGDDGEYATNHFEFSDNFIRAELDLSQAIDTKHCDDLIIEGIEENIIQQAAKVIIVDNVTYLAGETEQSRFALPLMKRLKQLKNEHDLSILVIAHTPKRDQSQPIAGKDLQGSSMLMNFCDSSFAVGRSWQDDRIRYVKQIKQRNTENIYGSEKVILFEQGKPTNCLQFTFLRYGDELDHLMPSVRTSREEKVARVKELHDQGYKQAEIAEQMNIAIGSVCNYLKEE